ncbi:MAG: hypothetical protein Q4D64_10625 [Prevotellaceae bacterium]|nr:hypothetical protein [Prevotellaceae bacterium]
MKKNILFIILLMAVASVARANDGKVILQSKGTVKFFDSSKVGDAIAAAVEGDTIDLASGTFNYSFTIDKNILLRGRSAESTSGISYSRVADDVTVTSPCTIEGIYFNYNVNVTKSAPGLRITSCAIRNLTFAEDMPGMTIERSWIRNELCLNNLKSKDININNCKIYYLYGGGSEPRACTFRNCNISNVYSYQDGKQYTQVDKFINCILESNYAYSYGTGGSLWSNVVVSCLWNVRNWGSDAYVSRYYFNDNEGKGALFSSPSYGTCSYTKEELTEKGYLGTDGTVVGADGGAYPFTLTPLNTQITTNTLTVDETTKKVTADVEVNVK